MEFNQPNLPPRKQPAGFTTPGGGGGRQFTTTLPDRPKTTGSNPRPTPRGCHPFARNNSRPQPKNKTKKEKRAWPAARSVSARTHVVGSESRKPVSFRGPGSKTGRAAAGGLRDSHRRKRRNSIIIAGDRSSARPDRHGRRGGFLLSDSFLSAVASRRFPRPLVYGDGGGGLGKLFIRCEGISRPVSTSPSRPSLSRYVGEGRDPNLVARHESPR